MSRGPARGTRPAAAAAASLLLAGGTAAMALLRRRRAAGRRGPAPSPEYRLRVDEALGDGLRRIAREEIDAAARRIDGRTSEEMAEAVHEARKGLKRLRTLVRLARDQLGNDVYRRENAAFRDVGRSLAGTRDRQVVLEVLDELTEQSAPALPAGCLAGLRSSLAADLHAAQAGCAGDGHTTVQALATLAEARDRLSEWQIEGQEPDALSPGLERLYRRGRKAFRAAHRRPTTEGLHEWRKRVKDLWHAARILRHTSPDRLKGVTANAHELSDLLGSEHDLAVLDAEIDRRRDILPDAATLTAARAVIEDRRARLRTQALAAGARLYARKPRRQIKWMLGR